VLPKDVVRFGMYEALPRVIFWQGTDIRTFVPMPQPWGAMAGAAAELADDQVCG